jgi:hypothetical protein
MPPDDGRLTFTRFRDLAVIAAVGAVAAYLLVRIGYSRLPVLPRAAGLSAALLGIGEALAGLNIRTRLRVGRRPPDRPTGGGRPGSTGGNRRGSGSNGGPGRIAGGSGELRPVDPLVAARALMVGKASSLGGAGLGGIWIGFLAHVVPLSGAVRAASTDTTTGIVGLLAALTLIGGALWLERCCVDPTESDRRH